MSLWAERLAYQWVKMRMFTLAGKCDVDEQTKEDAMRKKMKIFVTTTKRLVWVLIPFFTFIATAQKASDLLCHSEVKMSVPPAEEVVQEAILNLVNAIQEYQGEMRKAAKLAQENLPQDIRDRNAWIENQIKKAEKDFEPLEKKILDKFKHVEEFARLGHVEALLRTAHAYSIGLIVRQDWQKVECFLQMAASKNNALAQYQLGVLYLELSPASAFIGGDIQEGIELIDAAKNAGFPDAVILWAIALSTGELAIYGVPRDVDKAIAFLYPLAVQDHNPDAQFELYMIYKSVLEPYLLAVGPEELKKFEEDLAQVEKEGNSEEYQEYLKKIIAGVKNTLFQIRRNIKEEDILPSENWEDVFRRRIWRLYEAGYLQNPELSVFLEKNNQSCDEETCSVEVLFQFVMDNAMELAFSAAKQGHPRAAEEVSMKMQQALSSTTQGVSSP